MGGADGDRRLVIRRHSHAQAGDAMTSRQLREQREIRCRLDVRRRNAHEAVDRHPRLPASFEHVGDLSDGATALLRLVSDIYLDEAARAAPRCVIALPRAVTSEGDRPNVSSRTAGPLLPPYSTAIGRSGGARCPGNAPEAPAISLRLLDAILSEGLLPASISGIMLSDGCVLETAIRDTLRARVWQRGSSADCSPDRLQPFRR
jgi:hypothetical protein